MNHLLRLVTPSSDMHGSQWDDSPLPHQSIGSDGALLGVNTPWCEFTGYSREEVLGRPYIEFVPSDHREQFAKTYDKMLHEGALAGADCCIRLKSGEVRNIAVYGRLDGESRVAHCILVDITEHRAVSAALAESEARFKQLFECSGDAIIVHDGAQVLLANQVARTYFRVPDDMEVRGVNFQQFVHPDDLHLIAKRLLHLPGGSDMDPMELRLFRLDGSLWHAEATSSWLLFDGQMAMQSTIRDLTARKRTERKLELYREQLEELVAERTASLVKARAELDSVTAVIARAVELRDPYTAGHQRRVAELSVAIAREIGMTPEQVDTVRTAAVMHDIGKISIPAEILSKPGRFSPLEYELVKSHSQAGYDILASAEIAHEVAEMVYQHHERMDGSGYPRGLTGPDLLPGARVLMVADVVEAISSHRPYRPAIGTDVALEEITSGRDERYPAEVVDACVSVFDRGFQFCAEA